MARNGYQVWTSDMVVGAAIVIIGIVAMLARFDIIVLRWSVPAPALVDHLWPLLLIGIGVLLWCDHHEHAPSPKQFSRSGERQ